MKEIEMMKEIKTSKEKLNSLKAKEKDMKCKYVDEILEEEVERKFKENVPSDLTKLFQLANKTAKQVARKKRNAIVFLVSGSLLFGLISILSRIPKIEAMYKNQIVVAVVALLLLLAGLVLGIVGIVNIVNIKRKGTENKVLDEEYRKLNGYENISIKNNHLAINGIIVMNLASYTTYKKNQNYYNPLEKRMLSKTNDEKMKFIQEQPILLEKLNEKLKAIKKEETEIESIMKGLSDSLFMPEPFLQSNTFIDTVLEAHEEFKNINDFSELMKQILQCFEESRSDNYETMIKNKSSINEIVKATNEFLDYKYIPNFLQR